MCLTLGCMDDDTTHPRPGRGPRPTSDLRLTVPYPRPQRPSQRKRMAALTAHVVMLDQRRQRQEVIDRLSRVAEDIAASRRQERLLRAAAFIGIAVLYGLLYELWLRG